MGHFPLLTTTSIYGECEDGTCLQFSSLLCSRLPPAPAACRPPADCFCTTINRVGHEDDSCCNIFYKVFLTFVTMTCMFWAFTLMVRRIDHGSHFLAAHNENCTSFELFQNEIFLNGNARKKLFAAAQQQSKSSNHSFS